MHQKQLFAMVREKVKELLNGYVDHEMLDAQIDQYIVAPALGENPGILGAMCLGILEWKATFHMNAGEKRVRIISGEPVGLKVRSVYDI